MEFQSVQAGGIGEAEDLMIELFCTAKKVRKKAPALDLSPPASGCPAGISEGGIVMCFAVQNTYIRSDSHLIVAADSYGIICHTQVRKRTLLLRDSLLLRSKAAQLFSERFTVGAAAKECARRSIEHSDGKCASASGDPGGEQTRKSERK
jgi:hypothetical protein